MTSQSTVDHSCILSSVLSSATRRRPCFAVTDGLSTGRTIIKLCFFSVLTTFLLHIRSRQRHTDVFVFAISREIPPRSNTERIQQYGVAVSCAKQGSGRAPYQLGLPLTHERELNWHRKHYFPCCGNFLPLVWIFIIFNGFQIAPHNRKPPQCKIMT